MKKEDNVPNSSRDFSDVKRTCNRVLQRMYSEWQAEVANVRAMEHCTLQMAQANLLNANTCQQMEKKQHDELKKEHEALKSKLQQASSSEEEAVRKVASLNMTHQAELAEIESKHEAALLERDREHKAEILEIQKQHDAKVMEAASKLTKQLQDQIDDLKAEMDRRKAKDKAKLEQAKKEYRTFRAKVSQAVIIWNKKTKGLQRKVHNAQLQLELHKACTLQKI